MSEIIKIALLGIAGVLFAIQFRQQRPEYTLLIGFALSVLVFSSLAVRINSALKSSAFSSESNRLRISLPFSEKRTNHRYPPIFLYGWRVIRGNS